MYAHESVSDTIRRQDDELRECLRVDIERELVESAIESDRIEATRRAASGRNGDDMDDDDDDEKVDRKISPRSLRLHRLKALEVKTGICVATTRDGNRCKRKCSADGGNLCATHLRVLRQSMVRDEGGK